MTRLAAISCGGAVTAEMTVRYVRPARIGEKLFIRGELVRRLRKLAEMKASLADAEGSLIAHATVKAIISSSKLF